VTDTTSPAPPSPSERPAPVPGVEARTGRFPGPSLIPDLHAIQDQHGWLPREELEALARRTRRPLYEIQGLISFYPFFHTTPPAPVEVAVCHDLPCWLRGADEHLATLRESHGNDEAVGVDEVSCLGRCDVAPAATVNERPCPMAEVDDLITVARSGELPDAEVARYGGGDPWPNDPYRDGPIGHYRVVRSLLAGDIDAATVIPTLKDSGLRGMGGAGFPTAVKWEMVAGQDDPIRYAICNADESEPGTFKDRQVLAEQAHLVLEGMLIGMVVVGAEEGIVFIRHEYGPEEDVLRAEIARLRELGLLGDDVLGTGRRLDISVFTSPGGYILGEETALIECLEGHRGEPRNKPPFPGQYGLWGRPTLMNSVETFAHVPIIVDRGAAWWRDQGIGDAVGWKFFSVSGDVEVPGVHCLPMGTPLREVVERCGGIRDGRALAAIQPGGASTNLLGPDALDLPMDFGPLAEAGSALGSGAVVVIAEGTDLLAAATNVLRFFRDESCGKCVPCRVGSDKAHTLLREVLDDGATLDGAREGRILELEQVLRRTSICGLGQVALGPVKSVLELRRA
jgi:formate dehydrogenase beta subunit